MLPGPSFPSQRNSSPSGVTGACHCLVPHGACGVNGDFSCPPAPGDCGTGQEGDVAIYPLALKEAAGLPQATGG